MSAARTVATSVAGRLVTAAIVVWGVGVGGGCTVTNGSGELHGSLVVPACTFSKGNPVPLSNGDAYSLSMDFFVGEPFDSTTPRFPANQLDIRAQASSAREEFADSLQLWVLDSYEVGRCVRGRLNADMSPDWDPRYCDRSPGASEGRVLVGTEGEIITGAFVLYYTCPDLAAAMALGSCAGGTCPSVMLCPGRGSWISFSQFGGATPADNASVLGRDFKVNDGDNIRSSAVHLELCDKTTVDGQTSGKLPIPLPQITGTLDGSFQFDLRPDLR